MIGILEVQSALVQWMKANTTIASQVPNTYGEEIRELEWRGDKFVFPNIRVRVDNLKFEMNNCLKATMTARIFVFSEEYSSLECNTIAGKVTEQFHGKSMNVTLPSATIIHFVGVSAIQNGADTDEEGKTWTAILNLSASVN